MDEPDAYFPVKITKRKENLLKLFNMKYSIYRIVDEAEIQENLFEMKGLIRDGLLELTEKQKEKIIAELEYVDAKLASIDQFEHVNYGWKQEEPQRVRNYMNRINRFIKKYDE